MEVNRLGRWLEFVRPILEVWRDAPSDRRLFAAAIAVVVIGAAIWGLIARRRRRGRQPPASAGPTGHGDQGVRSPSAPGLVQDSARWGVGLARTRQGLTSRLLAALRSGADDAEAFRSVEEVLLSSDVGIDCTTKLLAALQRLPRSERSDAAIQRALADEIRALLTTQDAPMGISAPEFPARPVAPGPWVVLVVGVNGVGKTTTIGKLAARLRKQGREVLLVAGDTFRAAAIDQLTIWAERTGAQIVRSTPGSDPSAVTFDGIRAAVARGVDVVLVDTAGRLHTKSNLMDELRKVRRVIQREIPEAPHEVLLVLDATTGQNAIAQARSFSAATGVTGVALTKLDGSARGGVILAIREGLGLPVQWVGLGEGVDDLEPFDPEQFVSSLVSPTGPP